MGRKLNTRKWRNTRTGETYMSYEDWSLQPHSSIATARMLTGRAELSGIPAPSGYMWCKTVEIHPPDGEDWVAM